MTDLTLEAAAAAAFAGESNLAYALLRDWRRRVAGKVLIQLLRQNGFPLDSPSGAVLGALLESGAVTPEEAFAVYLQLRESEMADLQVALRMRQLEELELRKMRELAQIRNLETQQTERLASLLYDDKIEALDNELEAIRAQKRAILTSVGAEVRKADLEDLDAREKAALAARFQLVEQKRRFVYRLTEGAREGKPVLFGAPEALAREQQEQQSLIKALQIDNAKALSELEVDEAFIQFAEATAFSDVADIYSKSGQRPAEAIEKARRNYTYYKNYLRLYVGPGYSAYFGSAYEKATGGLLFDHTVQSTETEEGSSLFQLLLGAGAGMMGTALASFTAKRFFKWIFGRGKSGPMKEISEEAKRRASTPIQPSVGKPEVQPRKATKRRRKGGRRKK